jgi:hypothetical protein
MLPVYPHEDKTQKKESGCEQHEREFVIIISRWLEQIAQFTQVSNLQAVNEHDGKAQ